MLDRAPQDNKLRRVMDTSLPGLENKPDFDRKVLEQVKGEEKPMKKKLSVGFVLVIALVLATTVALAAVILSTGYVNWNGVFAPSDIVVAPTLAPELITNSIPNNEVIGALLVDIPDGEFWLVSYGNGSTGAYGFLGPRLTTLEELRQHLKGIPLLLPVVPSGYSVTSVELSYNQSLLEAQRELYETVPYGSITLNKYKLRPVTDRDIDGYFVQMKDQLGHQLSIGAFRFLREAYEEPEQGEFLVDEGDRYEPLTVAGFGRALAITRTDGAKDVRLEQTIDADWLASYYVYMQSDMDVANLFEQENGD